MITHRHIFYVAGNDPRGVDSYYKLFQREFDRFKKVSSVEATVGDLQSSPDQTIAQWSINARTEQWNVTTTYDFLRWDDIIATNMKRPTWLRYLRAFSCFARNLVNGTIARVFRASWKYGLAYLYPNVGLVLTLAVPLTLGWGVARLASGLVSMTELWACIVGSVAAIASYPIVRRIADKYFVTQLTEARLWFDDWARGRRPDYAERTDAFARHIISKTRSSKADEVLVIGHSGGGAVAVMIIARALEIDPTFALAVPHVALATLGSLLPLTALHRHAVTTRDAIRRLATERSITWVDVQARQDVMNFYLIDPVRDVGVKVNQPLNPMMWRVSIRDLVSPMQFRRMRLNIFRMHFQFIMANDWPARYDYFSIVCGPITLADRARPHSVTAAVAAPTPKQESVADSAVDRYANP